MINIVMLFSFIVEEIFKQILYSTGCFMDYLNSELAILACWYSVHNACKFFHIEKVILPLPKEIVKNFIILTK